MHAQKKRPESRAENVKHLSGRGEIAERENAARSHNEAAATDR